MAFRKASSLRQRLPYKGSCLRSRLRGCMRESLPHAAGVTKRFKTVSQNKCGAVSFLFAFFLLYPSVCERCTNILVLIWQRKTEYPRHPTDYRNALAKERVFDKIIAKSKNDRTTEKTPRYTREENECEALPSLCRTGSSPGRTAPRQPSCCPTHGTRRTVRTAATTTGAAPAPTAPPSPPRRSTRLRSRSGSSSRASTPAPRSC